MWYIILMLIIVIYILINLVLPSITTGTTSSYIIQPILYTILAITTYILARNQGCQILNFKKIRRWQIGKTPLHAGLLIGGFHLSLLIIAGLLMGFGNSPNKITPQTFIIFLVYISTALIGIELARAYLIKKTTKNPKQNITLIISATALLFMLIQIKLTDIAILNPSEPVTIIEFIGATIIPTLAISLFASYLSYYGGALPAISYLGILKAFETYSPILPDIDWITKSFIAIIATTIGFLLIQYSIQEMQNPLKNIKRKHRKDSTLGWLSMALVCLLLVFFSYGYFGVQPTIISSGSMQPALQTGDIVIIEEVPLDEIQTGDIVQYTSNNFSTVHRVHEIQKDEEGKTLIFITKGDANNKPDVDPVKSNQITGKGVFTIPKIGWIPLIIKSLFKNFGLTI